MTVRLNLSVGDLERYVIAKYFAVPGASKADAVRARATRAQVRRFVLAACRSAVSAHAENLRGRGRATARRLSAGYVAGETLRPPREEQRRLVW